jgi:hypothetical protein
MRPQRFKFFPGQLVHEVGRKPLQVAADLFVQPFGGYTIKGREIAVHMTFWPAINSIFLSIISIGTSDFIYSPKSPNLLLHEIFD